MINKILNFIHGIFGMLPITFKRLNTYLIISIINKIKIKLAKVKFCIKYIILLY